MSLLVTSNADDFTSMRGNCYCGLITYTMKAPPIFVNCCHCRNCQQLSGSAFAINIVIEAENVEVTSDTQPRKIFDKDGKGAGAVRCPEDRCGTMLWASHPSFNNKIIFLRAGTLNENERIVPDAHFFVRSKHPWVTIPEEAKQFDTLGGKDDPPLWSAKSKRRVELATKQE